MKNITEEMNSKILDDPEESLKRRTFTGSTGKEFEMPEKVLRQLIGMTTYYEVDKLQDVHDNWGELSAQKRIPFNILKWFASKMVEQAHENPHLMEQMKEQKTTLKQDFDKLLGDNKAQENESLLGKLTGGKIDLPNAPTHSLYLNAVKLEKIGPIESGSLIGSEYEITDMHGVKIKAYHIREDTVNSTFENHKTNPLEEKEKLDMMRLDPRPAIVVCNPLPTKTPMLQILRVQSGGKAIAPEIPMVPGF